MTDQAGQDAPIVLNWDPREGMARYRIYLQDATMGIYLESFVVDHPPLELDAAEFRSDHRYEWTLQGLPSGAGADDWVSLTPYVAVPTPPPDRPVIEFSWPQSDVTTRLLVDNRTNGRFAAIVPVLGDRYALPADMLIEGHEHTYRIQELREDGWQTTIEGGPLPPVERPRVDEAAAVEEPGAAEHLFLWTCDTEVDMSRMRDPDPARAVDHLVFGVHESRQYGIGFMMSVLEQFGMRGTFFVDVLMEYRVGQAELERVIGAIAPRGHDIELLMRPAPNLEFADDPNLARLAPALTEDDAELFREALAIAVDLFERRVGRPPVAYRSGSSHICDAFLETLPEFGIRIDSSLNPFKNCRVSEWMRTQPFWVGPLLEIPAGWLAYRDATGVHSEQLAPVAGGRRQDAIAAFQGNPGAPTTVVYNAHGSSLLTAERLPAGEVVDPPLDRDRTALMIRLLQAVSSRRDMRPATFRELVDGGLSRWPRERASTVDRIPLWDDLAEEPLTTGTPLDNPDLLAMLEAERSAAPVSGAS